VEGMAAVRYLVPTWLIVLLATSKGFGVGDLRRVSCDQWVCFDMDYIFGSLDTGERHEKRLLGSSRNHRAQGRMASPRGGCVADAISGGLSADWVVFVSEGQPG